MPSSTKVFKASNVYGGQARTKIDTQFIQEEAVSKEVTEEELLASKVQKSKRQSQELLKDAKQEAEQILEEAKQEAEQIKAEAELVGVQEGKEQGYQEGLEKGFSEGLKKSEVENQQMKQSILTRIQETQTALEQYKEDNKQNIVLLASHMAEKIVHEQIDSTSEGILSLAKPYLYQLEKDEEFVTITVHPSQKEKMDGHKEEIETISPNTRFLIFADPELEKRELIIESSKSVINLQIKQQIDAMMQEFEEMERTVDA